MNRPRRLLAFPLLLATALASSACGDDTVAPRVIDFDALQAALNEDMNAFVRNGVASRFLTDAVGELGDFGVEFETAPSAPVFLAPNVELPVELHGRTFVYDDGSHEWVLSDTRLAPDGVVRVVWYEVDGLRRPLVTEEIGYFDLTDEDGGGMSRMGVVVVSTRSLTEEVVADYEVGYASTGSGSEWAQDFAADGYFTDPAGERIDFELTGSTEGDEATGAGADVLALTYHSPRVSYSLNLDQAVTAGETDGHEDIDIDVVHAGATTSVDLERTGPPNAFEGGGTVRHQNAVVAEITASGSALEYRKPDGGEFSSPDRVRIQVAVATMLSTAYYLLATLPLLEL